MDKTGTITMGEPEVAAVHPLAGRTDLELMALAASLEARSSHPLARAILEQAEGDGVPVAPAEDVRTVPGRGLEGRVGSRAIRSEEHTSELQSLMRISYAVFCLKKKKKNIHNPLVT